MRQITVAWGITTGLTIECNTIHPNIEHIFGTRIINCTCIYIHTHVMMQRIVNLLYTLHMAEIIVRPLCYVLEFDVEVFEPPSVVMVTERVLCGAYA